MRRFHFWSQFAHISLSDEIKTASWRQKYKPVFETFLEVEERCDVSEHRFGIYAQKYVYMEALWTFVVLSSRHPVFHRRHCSNIEARREVALVARYKMTLKVKNHTVFMLCNKCVRRLSTVCFFVQEKHALRPSISRQVQDLVQIVTNDFKTELREENHWLLFAPIPVQSTCSLIFPKSRKFYGNTLTRN